MNMHNAAKAAACVAPYIFVHREEASSTKKDKTSEYDPVTYLDLLVQMYLMQFLTLRDYEVQLPHIRNSHQTCHAAQSYMYSLMDRECFVAEEQMSRVKKEVPSKGPVWIIDSIDGTRVFCEKNLEGQYTTMITRMIDGKYLFTIIADISENLIYGFSQEGVQVFKLHLDEFIINESTVSFGTIRNKGREISLEAQLRKDRSISQYDLMDRQSIDSITKLSVICRHSPGPKTRFAKKILEQSKKVHKVEGSVGWMMKEAVMKQFDVFLLQAGRDGLVNFPWDTISTLTAMEALGYVVCLCAEEKLVPLKDSSVFFKIHDRDTDICVVHPCAQPALRAA